MNGIALIPFSLGHYKKTMLGLEFHNICQAIVSEVVQTYLTGVSPVCTGLIRNIHSVHSQTLACGTVRICNG